MHAVFRFVSLFSASFAQLPVPERKFRIKRSLADKSASFNLFRHAKTVKNRGINLHFLNTFVIKRNTGSFSFISREKTRLTASKMK